MVLSSSVLRVSGLGKMCRLNVCRKIPLPVNHNRRSGRGQPLSPTNHQGKLCNNITIALDIRILWVRVF